MTSSRTGWAVKDTWVITGRDLATGGSSPAR
jgi:hypothetical protein